MKPAAILLAAGGSRRMGEPKQLLVYQGQPLVRHAAANILAAGYGPVCVVVGHRHAEVAAALDGLDVSICTHPDWSRGIGSSLRVGVAHIESIAPNAPAVLIALADQPNIPVAHLSALAAALHDDIPIAASSYTGTPGVPALFSSELFPALRSVPDDAGAKAILVAADRNALAVIPLAAFEDIDSPKDYRQLVKSSAKAARWQLPREATKSF